MADELFLHDIKIPDFNPGMSRWLQTSPVLGGFLEGLGEEFVRRYQAKVAKCSGDLAATAEAHVRIGGHDMDRQILVITVGGVGAASTWKGKPFYYGVLHDLGTPHKRQRFPGAKDLREVTDTM